MSCFFCLFVFFICFLICAESFLHFSQSQRDCFVGFHVRANHPPNISMRATLVDLLRLSLGLVWTPKTQSHGAFPLHLAPVSLTLLPAFLDSNPTFFPWHSSVSKIHFFLQESKIRKKRHKLGSVSVSVRSSSPFLHEKGVHLKHSHSSFGLFY